MTKSRGIDDARDWFFGKGANDYVRNQNAIAQNINTRLGSVTGDCFFDARAGIDWFNLLGQKNLTAVNLAVSAVILNTAQVTGILQLSTNLDRRTRVFTVQYLVQTIYSPVSSQFQFNARITA